MKDKNRIKENQFVSYYVDEVDGYSLFKEDRGRRGFYYTIYNPDMEEVISWRSYNDIGKSKDKKRSPIYQDFLKYIEKDKQTSKNSAYFAGDVYDNDDYQEDDVDAAAYDYDYEYLYPRSNSSKSNKKTTKTGFNYPGGGYYNNYWGYDDDDYDYPYYRGHSTYQPKPKKTGFFDEYTKSNTVVFHKTDNSTDMLAQIYEGKGWDVFRETSDLDTEELFKVVDAHERVVCLGHGSSYGLIGMFGPEMAPHLKDKKLFVIWCNADAYFEKYSIGQGQFITGNMPSEVWECSAAGCGNISKQLMLDNITYWSKLCADVCEQCLEGNVKDSVTYIRKKYLEKYGNHPVTIYNCNRTQCLGEPQPLPKYKFKGEALLAADKPIPGFDEKEFLKNPTEKASECPRDPNYVPPTPTYSYGSGYKYNYPITHVPQKKNKGYQQMSLFEPDDSAAKSKADKTAYIDDMFEKDYNDVTKFWEEEVLPEYTYVDFFLNGLDTLILTFVNKAENKFGPRISRGDLFDIFYDWAQTLSRKDFTKMLNGEGKPKIDAKPIYTPSAEGQKVYDYWNSFLPNYTKYEFLNSRKDEIKDALVRAAIDKFPNSPSTKLSDEEYKKELEALYGEWAAHVDNSKFKKPLGDA